MANSAWVEHVKEWARDRGLSYMCAMSMEDCKSSYQEKKMALKQRKAKPPKPPKPPKEPKQKKAKPPKPPKQKKLTKKEQLAEQMRLRQEAVSGLYKRMAEKLNTLEPEEPQDQENITMTMEEMPFEPQPEPVKRKGRPRLYATMDEAKRAKVKKTLEAYKKRKMASELKRIEEKQLAEQAGMRAEDINRGVVVPLTEAQQILKTLKRRGKTKIGKGIIQDVKNAVSVATNIKNVITGNIDYTAKTKSVLDKYANGVILSIKLHRTPLGKTLMSVLNLASGNTLNDKIKNSPYDKLFHLFMCIETTKGSFHIEKNEVINASATCKIPPNTETRIIKEIPDGLSVSNALENTKREMGDKYFSYNASSNNCQDYITAFLMANNIGDNNDISFVKQDTTSLFDGNPVFSKIVNSITNLGSAVSNITGGGAKNPCWNGYEQVGMKKKRGKKVPNCVPVVEGEGFEDFIKSVGATAGKPYEISGINPFTAGYNLGHDVIAPQLMKVLPPEKVKKTLGGSINKKSNTKYMANKWIEHVKDFSKKHNCSYREALRNPECKSSYKTGSGMPTNAESVVALEYNSNNLGVNKKSL